MTVTVDATSGRYVPASASEWTALLLGTGVQNPSFLWLCQEASGNLADSIGACTLTAANSPGYQSSVTGWSRKAVSWALNSTSRFDNTTTPPNGNANSLALFGYFYVTAASGADRFMASMTDFAVHLVVDPTGHEKIYDNAATAGTTVVSDGVVRPFLVVYNRAAGTTKLYTPTETVDGGYTSSAGAHTVLGAYPTLATPAGGCLYAAQWTGAAAEMSATDAANVLARLQNGPPSTAAVPTPVVGTDVPDHVAAALGQLLEQDKAKTNITNLVTCLVTPVQDLESALWQLLTQCRVTTAIASQLDALGKLVGQPRNGLADADYRTYIAARISANRSSGLTEDLLRVAKTFLNNTSALITAQWAGAGTVTVFVTGITMTDAQGAALASFEQTAVAAGIRVVVAYLPSVIGSTFRLDVGPGLDVGHLANGIG